MSALNVVALHVSSSSINPDVPMLIVGLMSGTSVDGVDAAAVEISGSGFNLTVDFICGQTTAYPPALRSQILDLCAGASINLAELAQLDDAIAHVFATAAQAIQADLSNRTIDLIASHGQTVFHRPPVRSSPAHIAAELAAGSRAGSRAASGQIADVGNTSEHSRRPTDGSMPLSLGYSWQLGRGAAIAAHTGITTISNFRAADIGAGGQGAPLVPPVDLALFSQPGRSCCVQNIGGIGNVTVLPTWDRQAAPPVQDVRGWDTGPGNALIDMAVQRLSQGQQTYDRHGAWAAQGTPCEALIATWLRQPFFASPPPKSTGRELFSPAYLDACWQDLDVRELAAADRLATLTDFTAATIAHSYHTFLPHLPDEVLLCGGGSRNQYLCQCLQQRLPAMAVKSTEDYGISTDFKEAIAFAVLGFWKYQDTPGNLPSVTGATQWLPLGDVHPSPTPMLTPRI